MVRQIHLSMEGIRWLNGRSFNMDEYPIESRGNTIELWDIQNAQMSMPHPMHMHGFSPQVVRRRNSPEQIRRIPTRA
ncbi:MAG: multicopper oxidase domain-containing protein [Acidobacteriota bacterium]